MDLPREETLRWIVTRYAGLQARHGDGIGTPALVQPTGSFFPDAFSATPEGVARLVARLIEHTPLREGLDVRLRFLEGDAEGEACGSGGCGKSACGPGGEAEGLRLRDNVREAGGADGGYLVELPVEAVGNPVVLTTTVARAAGHIVLREAGEDVEPSEVGGMSELSAIASGLGVLMLNGAHIYGKSCGGARISRHTHLALEEIAVAVALFAELHGVKPGVVKAHLETTQREAFADAHDWATSNPGIVTQLRTRPEMLEAGMFRVEETKGFFGKLFARRAASEEEAAFGLTPQRR